MNVYVGNLSFEVTDDELRELFEKFGTVTIVNLIKDRETGVSKGFGFVEMDTIADAEKAIDALDGQTIKGRDIKVNTAHPKREKSELKQRYG